MPDAGKDPHMETRGMRMERAAPRLEAEQSQPELRAASGETDTAFERYKVLLDLWSKENPIKTTKLQVLLAVNAILISVAGVSESGFTSEKWSIYVAGAIFSAVWTLSIGRTALFQEAWSQKLDLLAELFPSDERFQIHKTKQEREQAPLVLRIMGGVSSKWYLTFAPAVFTVAWIAILVGVLV